MRFCKNIVTIAIASLMLQWVFVPAESAGHKPQIRIIATGGTIANSPDGRMGVDTVLEQVEASMEVEFGRGGILTTRAQFGGRDAKKEGIWKVIQSTEQEVVVWFQLGQDDPAEIKVTILDQDTIKMVPPNIAVLNKTFTFHRVQQ